MPAQDSTLTTLDGLRLRLRVWTPEAAERGTLVVTHGHGEHLGRYNHIAEALCTAGYAVYTYDLRGHGRSGGKKGHSPTFLTYLDDLFQVHDLASREHARAPLWLLGHSMGGLVTLAYAIRRQPQVAGVVVSAPLLRVKYAPPPWKVLMARSLSRVLPSLTLPTGLELSVPMSHDEALLKSFPEADLSHALMSLRVGNDLLNISADTLARAPELKLPILVLQGADDGAIDSQATQEFYERAGSADKQFKLYPGLYHEIMNETERDTVMGDILAWLEKRG
jgi:acylglycerol lipase